MVSRKRNLDACREKEEAELVQAEMEATTKRVRSNPHLCPPWPAVPEATAWLELFKEDRLRFPILIVLGRSMSGKTEWAQTLFKKPLLLKVGKNENFPAGMRAFKRGVHDGIILDDLRDWAWLEVHQEKLQGKYNAAVEFAATPGDTCTYTRYLYQIPIVATGNQDTKHAELFETSDWLSNPGNRRLVSFPPGQAPAEGA